MSQELDETIVEYEPTDELAAANTSTNPANNEQRQQHSPTKEALMQALSEANEQVIAQQRLTLEHQEARLAYEKELERVLASQRQDAPPTNRPARPLSPVIQVRNPTPSVSANAPLAETTTGAQLTQFEQMQRSILQQSAQIAALSAQIAAMHTGNNRANDGNSAAALSATSGSPLAGQPRTINNMYGQPIVQLPNPPPSTAAGSYIGHRKLNDLPLFSGRILEWPMFSAAYRNSTQAFGYNPMENLFRLQKCLSGEAREVVACLLVDAANVDQVMDTLRMMYGRPEQLVRSQIDVVRAIAPLNESRLDLYPPFAARVQNLASVLDTDQTRQHLANPMLIDELANKLPVSRRMEWAAIAQQKAPYPTIKDFAHWISGVAALASLVAPVTSNPIASGSSQRRSQPSDRRSGTSHNMFLVSDPKNNELKPFSSCELCGEGHYLRQCSRFQRMTVADRWTAVKRLQMCFSCLRRGHRTVSCHQKRPCRQENCTRIHHELLHESAGGRRITPNPFAGSIANANPNHTPAEPPSNPPDAASGSSLMMTRTGAPLPRKLYLRVVPVVLYGPNGEFPSFAILDEGSKVTLVDAEVADRLGLTGRESKLRLKWFGDNESTEMSRQVNLLISAQSPGAERICLDRVQTVRNLNLPEQTLRPTELRQRFPLIDQIPVAAYENAVPHILIGVDNNHACMPSQVVEIDPNGLIATRTQIGWVIYGRDYVNFVGAIATDAPQENDAMEELHRLVERFHTVESFGVSATAQLPESRADARAKQLLRATTVRVGRRFETGLLWAQDDVALPDSRPMAVSRLLCVESKMKRDPEYARMYKKNVENFIRKGYVRKLSPCEAEATSPRTWYLPHFGHANANKPGKMRWVFDAAATVGKVSLNSVLLAGPDILKPLIEILHKFRVGSIGVCGDIEEMFPQVLIRREDQDSQRFLWRDGDASRPMDTYVMQVMTFGAKCSPCSAQYVKNRNAAEHQATYPHATQAIVDHHYVDDFVMSFATSREAEEVTREVTHVHRLGGFHLRNFRTNCSAVRRAIGGDAIDEPVDLHMDSAPGKILGMCWDTETDQFMFKLNYAKIPPEVASFRKPPTKRQMLSLMMSVFDPFGILCDIMLYAKLLVQEVWRIGCDWDDQVPPEIYDQWRQWLSELPNIQHCRLPRCYSPSMNTAKRVELHLFADASEHAFAAVAYWRLTREDNRIEVSFVAAKTRCAPKVLLSIPRLELQAAVLAARLRISVESCHNVKVDRVCFWSDSTTVLSWVRSTHRRYKPFVRYRIAELLETTAEADWRYIPTADNVADDATRAKYPPRYDPESRWLHGPQVLLKHECEWPEMPGLVEEGLSEEIRPEIMLSCQAAEPFVDVARFASYRDLHRTIAWGFRFSHNARNSEKRRGSLRMNEIAKAEGVLFRMAQSECFAQEIRAIRNKQPVDSSSRISSLLPYLDETGTMRMNGRLDAATILPESARRPIILPKDHHVTRLLIHHYHWLMRHQNLDAIVCAIRQRFWIPQLRSLALKVGHNCQYCKVKNAQPHAQVMGQLPEDRLTPYARPFSYTGLDYFGPVTVTVGRRTEKRWVALFTCLAVRAVHLELAADLSTDACIICVRNFMNLRGVPIRIRSDNGTNFIGAKKLLNATIDSDAIADELSGRGVEWLFNSPSNPEAGGCWERMVRSIKRVLAVTLVEDAPRVETMRSLLIEAANIVNSRPLTHLPVDPATEEPITPNHFLLGGSNIIQANGFGEEPPVCSLKQLAAMKRLKNRFWKQWINAYLPELTRRTKWHREIPPLKAGDLVLICDDHRKRTNWVRGRITEVFPGPDGRVRNALVRTTTGLLRRPSSRLALLDVGEHGVLHGGGDVEDRGRNQDHVPSV